MQTWLVLLLYLCAFALGFIVRGSSVFRLRDMKAMLEEYLEHKEFFDEE